MAIKYRTNDVDCQNLKEKFLSTFEWPNTPDLNEYAPLIEKMKNQKEFFIFSIKKMLQLMLEN